MVGVFCGESGGSWYVMITVRVAKVFLPLYVLVIILIRCLLDQVCPATERWVQRPREGRVRDTWGPRFQSAGKQDKELRSALGYVVSGDAIVGVEELWESINVS